MPASVPPPSPHASRTPYPGLLKILTQGSISTL